MTVVWLLTAVGIAVWSVVNWGIFGLLFFGWVSLGMVIPVIAYWR